VPIQPIVDDTYAFYAVPVDGFNVTTAAVDGRVSASFFRESWKADGEEEGADVEGEEEEEEGEEEGLWFENRKRARKTKEKKQTTNKGIAPISMSTAQHISTLSVTGIIDSGTTHMYLPNSVCEYIASQCTSSPLNSLLVSPLSPFPSLYLSFPSASFLFPSKSNPSQLTPPPPVSPPATYSPSTGLYTAPCTSTPPSFGITIGGKTFWVDKRDLLSRENENTVKAPVAAASPSPGSNTIFANANVDADADAEEQSQWRGRLCVVQMQRQGLGDTVLGDAFLRGVVAVFDVGGKLRMFFLIAVRGGEEGMRGKSALLTCNRK
jgi:hypothetical protein